MTLLETHIRHASDWIDWIDRSGFAATDHLPLVLAPLTVALDDGVVPRDLRTYHKPGRTVLWRVYADTALGRAALVPVVDGRAMAVDIAPPAESVYTLSAQVADLGGHFNPRRFQIGAGNAIGHRLSLYRSPAGTRYQAAGGLNGRLLWDNGDPAAWALVAITVAPPVGPALPFVSQADGNGEFALPLSRLPALTRDAPSTTYPGTLSVTAAAAVRGDRIADPDNFATVNLLDPATGGPLASVSIDVEPGRVATVTSRGEDHIALQEP